MCFKELVTWCQQDVSKARKDGHIDTFQEKAMHDKILALRASMDGMYDYTDQPPHFFYIHFLVLLSALYLPLFTIDTAYSTGWGNECSIAMDLLNGLIVLLQCIFVVGLRSLGNKMIVSSHWGCLHIMFVPVLRSQHSHLMATSCISIPFPSSI